jgi:hypothetical protein
MVRIMFGIKSEGNRSVGKIALKRVPYFLLCTKCYYLRAKSRLIRWTGNVARMEWTRNLYRLSRRTLRDKIKMSIHRWYNIKINPKVINLCVCTEFVGLWIDSNDGLL